MLKLGQKKTEILSEVILNGGKADRVLEQPCVNRLGKAKRGILRIFGSHARHGTYVGRRPFLGANRGVTGECPDLESERKRKKSNRGRSGPGTDVEKMTLQSTSTLCVVKRLSLKKKKRRGAGHKERETWVLKTSINKGC